MTSANLTPRQLEMLVAVVAEMKPGEVDWDAVAPKANCKTAKYARDQFATIRKQLQACKDSVLGGENGDAATPKSKSTKKATPASKRKKEDDNVDDEEESPTKKKKAASPRKSKSATPAGKKTSPPNEGNGEGDGDGDGNGDVQVKAEPNEAGELLDDIEAEK